MSAIYKRELRSYFGSMYGYIYLAFSLCVIGVYVTLYNVFMFTSEMSYTFSDMAFLSIFLVPVLTMRSFAEERRNKTDLFLLSLPLSSVSIVLGKYLAMLTVFAIPVAATGIYALVLNCFSTSASAAGALASTLVSVLSYLLLGALMIAVCMFISSLTDSVVLAAVGGFAALLVISGIDYASSLIEYLEYLFPEQAGMISFIGIAVLLALIGLIAGLLSRNLTVGMVSAAATIVPLSVVYVICSHKFPTVFVGLLPSVLSRLSAFTIFSSMTLGTFSLSGLVFFASAIFLCVYLTVRSLERRRHVS